MKILTTPRMERCIGCHSCSLACARIVHKRLSWDTAEWNQCVDNIDTGHRLMVNL